MRRTLDISGRSLLHLFYASSVAALVAVVPLVVWPLDDIGSVALALLLASLVCTAVVGLWRRRTDRDGEHLGTDADIAYDPIAYPGQAAKHSWTKAVRRLPGEDDEGD